MSEAPDRETILHAVMPDVLTVRLDRMGDAVGTARIVSVSGGVAAGLPVVKEIFGRVGVRTRPLVVDGAVVGPGQAVAQVGGPLAAARGAAPVALTWLQRLSAVATGTVEPERGHALDAWAAGLSAPDAAREGTPSFRLEFEGLEEG